MNLKLILPTLLLTSLLVGCGSAPKIQGSYAVQLSHAPNQVKRVAISSFYVQFVTTQGHELERWRELYTISAMVNGLSQNDMQQVADGLYDQLVAEFKKENIEVVGQQELSSVAAYNSLKSDTKKSPFLDDSGAIFKASTMVSASGLPIYLHSVPDVNVNDAKKPDQWQWIGPSAVETFGAPSIVKNNMEISKALNAATIAVRVVVPFVAEMDVRQGHGWRVETAWKEAPNAYTLEKDAAWGGTDYTLKIVPGARIAEGGTRISISNTTPGSGDNGSNFTLNKPITLTNVGLTATEGNGSKDGGLVGLFARSAGAGSDTADFFIEVDADSLKQAMKDAGSELFRDVAMAIKNPPK